MKLLFKSNGDIVLSLIPRVSWSSLSSLLPSLRSVKSLLVPYLFPLLLFPASQERNKERIEEIKKEKRKRDTNLGTNEDKKEMSPPKRRVQDKIKREREIRIKELISWHHMAKIDDDEAERVK